MKRKNILRAGMAILLVLTMATGLVGCPAPGPGPDGTTPSGGTTTNPGGNETPGEGSFANGAAIKDTGDTLADAPVLDATTYDAAAAVEKTPAQIKAFFRPSGKLDPDQIFRVSGDEAVSLGTTDRVLDAKGMILIAPHGVVVSGVKNTVLQNLTVIGSLSVVDAENVRFENVRVLAEATAVSIDSASESILFTDCRIEGGTAADIGGAEVGILRSYIGYKTAGISSTAAHGLYIAECRIEGVKGVGIASAADNTEIRRSTVKTDAASAAIQIGAARNVLVGASQLLDAQKSIVLDGTDNAQIALTSAVSISSANGKHIYIVDNALGGKLILSDNDYLIADGNSFPDGNALSHTDAIGNTNTNGDNLMDVTKRLSVGADKNLTPHIDKDQFLLEERQDTVKDPGAAEPLSVNEYILANAAASSYVILMPGAYTSTATMTFGAAHKDTVVYAYGAMIECPIAETDSPTSNRRHVLVTRTENITLKGAFFGYERDSAGQVYVLEKIEGGTKIRVHAAAGFYNDFLNSNLSLFNATGANVYRPGEMYPSVEMNANDLKFFSREADGTMIFTASTSFYNKLMVGDVITCRNLVGAGSHISTEYSSGVLYEDVTIYGNSGGACFYEGYVTGAVTYHRVTDTAPTPEIIDKETYDKYKKLEADYGITTDVAKDGDLYRGDISRYSSIDATHVVGSRVGSQIISCLFESMCDDATNQHSYPSRLSYIEDNGDGTATVVFKPLLADVSYNGGNRKAGSMTQTFSLGDRIFIYNNDGELICDANVLTAQVELGSITYDAPDQAGITIKTYSVTVPSSAVHFENLEGYTLDTPGATTSTWAENSNSPANRISVDNRSYYADGFLIDNLITRNVRSRALLIKSSDGIIKNCTLENFAGDGVSVSYEHTWAESGVVENLIIENNLFDHVGYNNDRSAIRIFSMGYPDFTKDSVFAHFTIRGNVIRNRASTYAVQITGAMDVTFEDNDFGSIFRLPSGTKPQKTVMLDSVRDVVFAGNTWPDKTMQFAVTVDTTNVAGITGSDLS